MKKLQNKEKLLKLQCKMLNSQKQKKKTNNISITLQKTNSGKVWHDVFQILKVNKCQWRLLHPKPNLSFKIHRE